MFVSPHGLTIGPDGTVYCAHNMDHTIKQFTADGRLLRADSVETPDGVTVVVRLKG